MDLNTVWFALVAVLVIGFFLLEGFDYGVGILLPFLGKDDQDRRVIINTIGPYWDGNEVWLITAGGAIFAAFPEWYATMFSGFYLALLLMLVALIVRGVAFEFRSKDRRPQWRGLWDWMIFFGSFVPALLWGVAFANLIRGVPINADMQYVGTFWDLLNPYALVGGLATLSAFTLHGAVFLSLKTKDELEERAHKAAARVWLPTVIIVFALCHRWVLCYRHVHKAGRKSRSGSIGCGCGLAGSGLVHPPAAQWMGLFHDGVDHCSVLGHGGHRALSPGHGFQP